MAGSRRGLDPQLAIWCIFRESGYRGAHIKSMFIFRTCGIHALPAETRSTILIFTMPKVSTSKARYGRLLNYCSPTSSFTYIEAGFDSLILNPNDNPVSLLAALRTDQGSSFSFPYHLHSTEDLGSEDGRWHRRQVVPRANQLQWLHPSSHHRRRRKAIRCIGDPAQVREDGSDGICDYLLMPRYRMLHVSTTQKEVR